MSQRFPDALSHETKTILDWGGRLANLTGTFQRNHPDAMVIEFSTYKVLDAILDKPSVYTQTASLKNLTGFCDSPQRSVSPNLWLVSTNCNRSGPNGNTGNVCKVPVDEYFWFNNLHPTFPVHDALASEITVKLTSVPKSPSCSSPSAQSQAPRTLRLRQTRHRRKGWV
jgi:phospholipase/lecithinase/hemolysin